MTILTTQFTFRLALTALITLSLAGCGLPGPGGGTASSPPPDAEFVPVTEIPIRVEANDEMVASWQQDLFNLVTPERAYALSGLEEITTLNPLRFSIVTLDENFQEGGYSSLPDYRVEEEEGGGYVIQIDQNYYGQIDIVAKVRFSNGTVLYAPLNNLSNSNINSVVINVGSHYVLKKLFDQINTKAELDALRPCSTTLCSDQWRLKADLLKNLNATIQDYDINIPSTASRDEALDLLEQNVDLRTQVERMIAEITRTKNPIHEGINRAFNITDPDVQECLIKSRDHNSAWFGLMLSDLRPDNAQDEIMFATATSSLVSPGLLGNSKELVPILQQSTDIREIRRETLTVKNYISRDTLSIDESNNHTFDDSEPFRTMFSSTSSSYISTEGFMLYDRTFPPNTPTVSDNIGQQFNPVFSKLYRANNHACATDPEDYSEAPAWLVSANAGTGASYALEVANGELTTDDDGKFVRDEQVEQQNLFSWEIYSEETETTFAESALNDKRFGAINFSIDLNDSGEAIAVNAQTHFWEENNGNISQNQPHDHYSTYRMARMDDQSLVALSEQSDANIEIRPIFTVPTLHQSDTTAQNYGVMGLDGGAQASYGHATQDARYMAFTLNNDVSGRGLLIAQELRSSNDFPIFDDAGENYTLMGNTIQLSGTANTLQNLNDSILNLSGNVNSCSASLTLSTLSTSHNLTNNTLSDLTPGSQAVSSSACRLGTIGLIDPSGSEIELTFDNVNGQPLTLKGFVSMNNEGEDSPPLITLLWVQQDTLGLVFAAKNQSLSEGFE